jgi:hypothetical protein
MPPKKVDPKASIEVEVEEEVGPDPAAVGLMLQANNDNSVKMKVL